MSENKYLRRGRVWKFGDSIETDAINPYYLYPSMDELKQVREQCLEPVQLVLEQFDSALDTADVEYVLIVGPGQREQVDPGLHGRQLRDLQLRGRAAPAAVAGRPAGRMALRDDGIVEGRRSRRLVLSGAPRGGSRSLPDRRRDDPRLGTRGADDRRG